jgi:chromate reductase
MNKKYIAISGSLRKESYNSALLKAVQSSAPEGVTIEIADISTFPLFSQDLETEFPAVVQNLKDKIIASDGVIFATPEYNRTVPGVLKNVIDWLSRPYGMNALAGKSALVMGASIGPIGTAVAQSHLKQILLYLDMKVIGQPEFYMGTAQNKFDGEGVLTDETTKEHIVKALNKLINW